MLDKVYESDCNQHFNLNILFWVQAFVYFNILHLKMKRKNINIVKQNDAGTLQKGKLRKISAGAFGKKNRTVHLFKTRNVAFCLFMFRIIQT